ncbi:hypothetical protein RRG08_046797 [Elysia crispata]|uniref:Uncharacterized protein n=1 Tax=Elysia crispata TaxID=231223 RepID=A0AAE1DN98_9GAST|nr:hypothetical protein RRG08_046797 [Elysia crispata]
MQVDIQGRSPLSRCRLSRAGCDKQRNTEEAFVTVKIALCLVWDRHLETGKHRHVRHLHYIWGLCILHKLELIRLSNGDQPRFIPWVYFEV